MITDWTLPRQLIRDVGTTAADLFELLLTLAVDGIVRGMTITRLTGRYNSEFSGSISDRTTNAQIKRLADHGLIEIERYTRATKDADLQRRGDVRIRLKKTEGLQSKMNFDVRDRICCQVGDELGHEVRHNIKTVPIVAESPPIVQKPPEIPVPEPDCSKKISFSSLYQEHQEQERNIYLQEQSRNQKQQEPVSEKSDETIDDPVLRAVSEKIGDKRFSMWLGGAQFTFDNNCVLIVTKNKFSAEWVTENMLGGLSAAFEAATGRRRRVSVSWQEPGKPPIPARPPEKPKEPPTAATAPPRPKSQSTPQTPRRSETGGPKFLAEALKPAANEIFESAMPDRELFTHTKRRRLRDKLEKYFDLTKSEERQSLCQVVYCAIDLGRFNLLKGYLDRIGTGEIGNPGGYLRSFVLKSVGLCQMTLKEINDAGRELGIGKGLNKGRAV